MKCELFVLDLQLTVTLSCKEVLTKACSVIYIVLALYILYNWLSAYYCYFFLGKTKQKRSARKSLKAHFEFYNMMAHQPANDSYPFLS